MKQIAICFAVFIAFIALRPAHAQQFIGGRGADGRSPYFAVRPAVLIPACFAARGGSCNDCSSPQV